MASSLPPSPCNAFSTAAFRPDPPSASSPLVPSTVYEPVIKYFGMTFSSRERRVPEQAHQFLWCDLSIAAINQWCHRISIDAHVKPAAHPDTAPVRRQKKVSGSREPFRFGRVDAEGDRRPAAKQLERTKNPF